VTKDRWKPWILASNARASRPKGAAPIVVRLEGRPAVVLRRAASIAEARALAAAVRAARDRWTSDFGGEQFALGGAFYAHLETGMSREYFARASASDAAVEAALPGVQERTIALLARVLGAEVRRRPGFCGPGVHVFPAGGKVARDGGVVHYDLEGLTEHHKARGTPAVTLVWMIQPAARDGGLRLWDVLYDGRPDGDVEPGDYRRVTVRAAAGDAVLIDSRRLHQIRPFPGKKDRISITVHAVEVDRGVWESWF
jgi:hypothetical protein